MREIEKGEVLLPPRILRRIKEVMVLLKQEPWDVLTDRDLQGAFYWGKAPEGSDFWGRIRTGDYSEFDKMYPSYDDGEYTLENVFKL